MSEAEREGDPAFIITKAEAESYNGPISWPTWLEPNDRILNVDGAVMVWRNKDGLVWDQSYENKLWVVSSYVEAERSQGRRPIIEAE